MLPAPSVLLIVYSPSTLLFLVLLSRCSRCSLGADEEEALEREREEEEGCAGDDDDEGEVDVGRSPWEALDRRVCDFAVDEDDDADIEAEGNPAVAAVGVGTVVDADIERDDEADDEG